MNVVSILGQIAHRQSLRAALKRAYTDFANRNEDWTEYLFDEHFVTTRIAPLLLTGTFPSSATVVNAWSDQISWSKESSRQRTMADLTPAAAYFLQLLEAELQGQEPVSEIVAQSA